MTFVVPLGNSSRILISSNVLSVMICYVSNLTVFNLWRIYLKNTESRLTRLTRGIDINNVSFQFYDTNPYTSGATSAFQKTQKIRICGLPLSVADSAVHELLDKLKVKLTGKNLYEKIRHPDTKRMTSILNGTRFIYIEPLLVEVFPFVLAKNVW